MGQALASSWRSEVPLADSSADGTQPRVSEKLILVGNGAAEQQRWPDGADKVSAAAGSPAGADNFRGARGRRRTPSAGSKKRIPVAVESRSSS